MQNNTAKSAYHSDPAKNIDFNPGSFLTPERKSDIILGGNRVHLTK
jgi:hypothetical protein